MLFLPDAVLKARQSLLDQVDAGEITPEQAFQRALELDPSDAFALANVGAKRQESGDGDAAAGYYWRAALADPSMTEPWFRLAECYPGEDNSPLRDGILELAARKMLRDSEKLADLEDQPKDDLVVQSFGSAVALEVAADELFAKRAGGPFEVSARLRPYRLVDEVLDEHIDYEPDSIDAIVEEGPAMAPHLLGVLRAMASGSLPGEGTRPVIRALALLGEIGDPSVLPEIMECLPMKEPGIMEAATWAALRIASRGPRESFEIIQSASRGSLMNRVVAASIVSRMPALPETFDFLQSLLDGWTELPKTDRHDLFTGIAQALILTGGVQGKELVWSLYRRHATLLPKRTREELRNAELVSKVYHQAKNDSVYGDSDRSVYDLMSECESDELGSYDEDDDDEDFDPEPARRTVDLGRNDPCWCGSGKKYKKCHLDSDEARSAEPDAPEETTSGTNVHEAGFRQRVIEFAVETLGKKSVEKALVSFLGTDPPAGFEKDDLAREAIDWLIHDYIPPQWQHSAIVEFQKRAPGGLTAKQRNILDAWSRSRYSLYSVLESQRGEGVRVQDLLVGDEFFVHDVSTSKWARPSDCCLARMENFGDRHEFTALVLSIPLLLVQPLVEWAREARLASGLEWDAFLRANSHRLRQEASHLIKQTLYP